ncbi:MAG: hypothetical protein OCD02_20780 [Spirochaetaceae bacterium]
MKKIFSILIILLTLLSCGDKKKNIRSLFNVEDNIDLALKTNDPDLVDRVIKEIEVMEEIYPEHQSLKEKKYSLEIRLRRYDDAIATIDTLITLSPEDIDNRIVQGILFEIKGDNTKSKEVLEIALINIENKLESMPKTSQNEKRTLGRHVNRVMILKLLNRDTPAEYSFIKSDPTIANHPEILQLLIMLEKGNRENIINNYR